MALETDDNELDSSASTEIQDAAPLDTDAGAADSSTADGDSAEVTSLSVVRDVVEKRTEASAPPAEGSETGNDAGDANSQKEQDDENFSDVPFNKHPRFQKLIQQRNELKADATRYRNVQTFLDEQGLGAEEAANGLTIMAMAKHNPVEAWKSIKPWVQNLLLAAGEILPDDLAGRVRAGELPAETAAELARERARAQTATSGAQFAEQQRTAKAERERLQSLTDTVTDWENDRRTKDPNFAAKFPLLQREILWLHQTEGRPETADAARAQLAKAYATVNEKFAPPVASQPRPTPKPAIRPVTGGTAPAAAASEPKPKSTLDIIKQVQARRTG